MFELTDQAFTGVQPLLPANSRRGKPWRDHRQVLDGIMWKLHTGRPWRDVPERFGPWPTCYSRLRRWQADGTWPRIWALLAAGEHDSGHDRRSQASQETLPAAPVAAAGAGLMAAPPPRPPQQLADRRWRPPHQGGQQPARFGGRDPDQVRAGRLWQFCALSCPPRPPDRRGWPGRGPPPRTPGRPAPGSRAGTRRHSGGPGSGPSRPGPWRPGSTPRWSNHKRQVLLRAADAAELDLVAPAAPFATIGSP
jgi:transposase